MLACGLVGASCLFFFFDSFSFAQTNLNFCSLIANKQQVISTLGRERASERTSERAVVALANCCRWSSFGPTRLACAVLSAREPNVNSRWSRPGGPLDCWATSAALATHKNWPTRGGYRRSGAQTQAHTCAAKANKKTASNNDNNNNNNNCHSLLLAQQLTRCKPADWPPRGAQLRASRARTPSQTLGSKGREACRPTRSLTCSRACSSGLCASCARQATSPTTTCNTLARSIPTFPLFGQ